MKRGTGDPWSELPAYLRKHVERALGARIRSARRASEHPSASTALHLTLGDGRKVFFKAVARSLANDFMLRAMRREQRVYRELGSLLEPWAPAFIGAGHAGAWRYLLLEDVGPWDAPPWSGTTLEDAARGYALFHREHLGRGAPAWLDNGEWSEFAAMWRSLPPDNPVIDTLFDGSRQWLEANVGRLDQCAQSLAQRGFERTLLHLDTRQDNMVVHRRRLRLFDWAMAGYGPREFDVAAFAQSIAAQGGPAPAHFVALYERELALDRSLLMASVAGIAGYFWTQVSLPPIAAAPGLRAMQRAQLVTCLEWLGAEGVTGPIRLARPSTGSAVWPSSAG